MTDWPELVCPACRGPLADADRDALSCDSCDRCYPIVAGIPDLRLVPDRYLSFDADREKAIAVDQAAPGFEAAVSLYWSMTPEVPTELANRFRAATARGIERGAAHLGRLGTVGPDDVVIDVGCGTGGLLAVAASRGATVVGIDTALRWLVIARRYLRENGVDALLVAADGATPPFRSGSFTVVASIETLEHACDQRGLVNGCLALADRPGGRCLVVTANRFSIAPEPAVRLWGVGFLPRGLAAWYVERRRGTSYRFTRPVSLSELRAFVGPNADAEVRAEPLPPARAGASRAEHAGRMMLDRMVGVPAMTAVAPFLGVHRQHD